MNYMLDLKHRQLQRMLQRTSKPNQARLDGGPLPARPHISAAALFPQTSAAARQMRDPRKPKKVSGRRMEHRPQTACGLERCRKGRKCDKHANAATRDTALIKLPPVSCVKLGKFSTARTPRANLNFSAARRLRRARNAASRPSVLLVERRSPCSLRSNAMISGGRAMAVGFRELVRRPSA